MNPMYNEIVELKSQILDAAEERFKVYGYGKTTMAEIAKDVNMSAANLYRYFQNKEDIAVECCDRCMSERADKIRDAIRKPGLSAADRLRVLALTCLQRNIEEFEDSPKIMELIDYVSREHQELVKAKIAGMYAIIAEILAYGNETGEFDVKDIISTSRTVHSALVLFDFPMFDGFFAADEFEEMANNVVDLLVHGLRKV